MYRNPGVAGIHGGGGGSLGLGGGNGDANWSFEITIFVVLSNDMFTIQMNRTLQWYLQSYGLLI